MGSLTYNFSLLNVKELYNNVNLTIWNNTNFVHNAYWKSLANELFFPSLYLNQNFIFYTKTLFIYSFFVNIIFVFSIFLGLIFYISNQGLKLITNISSNNDSYFTVFSYLTDLEEEIGAADDTMLYVLIFAVVIIWFFFFTIFSTYFIQNLSWFVMLLNFVFLTALFMPIFVLKNFGIAFTTYLRGVGRTKNLVVESFFDFIAIAIMISRFIIQNIRLVLLFAAFFEISEFIFDNCDITVDNYFAFFNTPINWSGDNNNYWYDLVFSFLVQQILLIYYQGHLILTFFMQLANYFLLSFVLFFFLYTSFLLESHEKYFLLSKIQNLSVTNKYYKIFGK